MNKLSLTAIAGILLTGLSLSSCEEMVTEVDMPAYEPKLVVQSFISPDEENINVYVTESLPVFGTSNDDNISLILDATVKLKGNGQTITLPFTSYETGYSISVEDASLEAGETYTLEVSTPDGRSVYGSCTIPARMNTSLEITAIEKELVGWDSIYVISFRFTDSLGEGDHYRLWGIYTYKYVEGGEETLQELTFDKGEKYVSDENKDGTVFTYRSTLYAYNVKKVRLYLLTTDETYYTYHRSVEYNYGEDPFSEPTLVFTNINNGLGVFSGYRMYIKEFDL